MEKPRWLSLVLRTVGLMGEGEIGVRGIGDLRESDGREAALMLRESLGLAARVASILNDVFPLVMENGPCR